MRLRRRKAEDEPEWWLDDADARHRAAPRSFFIPPIEERRELALGRTAKLLFAFADRVVDGVPHDGERMWLEVVERREDGGYVGTLANEPRIVTELAYGDRIEFGPEHVIALEYSAEELGYAPGDPAIVDERVMRDDVAPDRLMRAQPPGESLSFWFAGFEREPPPDERRTVTLGDLTDRWPELASVFSSTGGAWSRIEASAEYRRVEPPADER